MMSRKTVWFSLVLTAVSFWGFAQISSVRISMIFLIVMFFHELSHAIAIIAFGGKIKNFIMTPIIGFVTDDGVVTKPTQLYLISLAGPASGLLVGSVGLVGYAFTSMKLFLSLSIVACIGNLMNLLPALPFDGGRMLYHITSGVRERKRSFIVLIGVIASNGVLILFDSTILSAIIIIVYMISFGEKFAENGDHIDQKFVLIMVTIAVIFAILAIAKIALDLAPIGELIRVVK